MKKLLLVLSLAFIAGACNPVETYDNCRDNRGVFAHDHTYNEAECGFTALGHMFIRPDWF